MYLTCYMGMVKYSSSYMLYCTLYTCAKACSFTTVLRVSCKRVMCKVWYTVYKTPTALIYVVCTRSCTEVE